MELTPTTRTKITALVARIRPGEPVAGGRLRKASSRHRLPGRIATLPSQHHGEESAAELPARPIWAGPGSTRPGRGRSRRIYMTLYIDEKRGDARPRTSKSGASVVYQTRSSGTSTTRTARRTRGSTPCLLILDPLYDRSCPRWIRGGALLPLAVGGARGRGRLQSHNGASATATRRP